MVFILYKESQGSTMHIIRPPNAFMIFANHWRKKIATEYPDENNKSISVRLGQMWKTLSDETKESFYEEARNAELEHKKKYPGYQKSLESQKRKPTTSSKIVERIDAISFVDVEINDEDVEIKLENVSSDEENCRIVT